MPEFQPGHAAIDDFSTQRIMSADDARRILAMVLKQAQTKYETMENERRLERNISHVCTGIQNLNIGAKLTRPQKNTLVRDLGYIVTTCARLGRKLVPIVVETQNALLNPPPKMR